MLFATKPASILFIVAVSVFVCVVVVVVVRLRKTENNKIPKMIHQSWKDYTLPKQFDEWSQTWKTMNPSYAYILWTDASNREFIRTNYPWFLKRYDQLPLNIQRADAARVFYLHKFGGVYADLDIVALKPIDPLLDGHALVLARMNTKDNPEHQIPNDFMASVPGHTFWLHCADMIMDADENNTSPEMVTGPVMIYRALKSYPTSSYPQMPIYIAESKYIHANSWDDDRKDACMFYNGGGNVTQCLDAVDPNREAFALAVWMHSWEDLGGLGTKGTQEEN